MARLLGLDDLPVRRRMDPDGFYNTYVYGLGRDFIALACRAAAPTGLAGPRGSAGRDRMMVAPDDLGQPVDAVDPEVRHGCGARTRLAADWRPKDA